ncbi:MAG: hypothetical protein E2576_14455 [Alcaligenaceae bacterium]|nr:hypothetical protein [Alcaligenaceae bacterium SAGV5]MPS50418.1 hypothetical protein [Alcaligenaceae bacterium SAGV3]MPT57921.1 hypothetical protein [Alcaligenaceae bacterium]
MTSISQLHQQHITHLQKHTYFLMASAGACLGFAITQTSTAMLAWPHVPLGIAVLAWGLSVWCGCKFNDRLGLTLYANFGLLEAQQRVLRGQMPAEYGASAVSTIRDAAEGHSDMAAQFGLWQFRLFVWGIIAFLVWHVWTMWLRVPATGLS